MNTEREIIYQILNTIRDAEHNEDERIPERLMRSFLRTYRAESLRKYYKDGHVVNDEVFQRIPIELTRTNLEEFRGLIPKIIRMSNHYGFYVEKNGISIPIVESEQYHLSKKNPFGKNLVQTKTEQNSLTLFAGKLNQCMNGENDNALLIGFLIDEVEPQLNDPQIKDIKINLDFFGVLHNPDDQPGYNWETDIFPFPSERLPELKGQILAKEFGIMVQAKKDEISNTRNDSVSPREENEI